MDEYVHFGRSLFICVKIHRLALYDFSIWDYGYVNENEKRENHEKEKIPSCQRQHILCYIIIVIKSFIQNTIDLT